MKAQDCLKMIKKYTKFIENRQAEKEQLIRLGVDIAELEISIEGAIRIRKNIIKKIEQLKPLEYDILHKLYVQDFTLCEVAELYDRSYSWITTMHGIALKNFQRVLDREGFSERI